MWANGSSSGQIAKIVGKSRNAVMGKVDRLGLMGKKGSGKKLPQKAATQKTPQKTSPKGPTLEQVKERADLIKRDIKRVYENEVEPDDIEIIQVLAAAVVFDITHPDALANIMDVDIDITTKIYDDMIKAGLWTNDGPGDTKRYDGKEGFLQFILESMLFEGRVMHCENGWYLPDAETPASHQIIDHPPVRKDILELSSTR